MNIPTIHTLSEVFGERAKEARALLKGDTDPHTYSSVSTWVSRCYNPPTRHECLMKALNELADGYGVEAVFLEGHMSPAFEYLNVGDSYTPTIIYTTKSGRFRVASLADVIERNPALRYT
jgi:hypothetical protein